MKLILLVVICISLQACGFLAAAKTATGMDQIDVADRVDFCPDGLVAEYEEVKRTGRHTVWFKCVAEEDTKHGRSTTK